MDILSYILSKKYTDKRIVEIAGGFHYKGAVNTRANLPTNAQIGDIYTVKFKDDGTTVWNAEFVWGKYEGTNQWIELGPDYEADIQALKTGKQDKLTAGTNITIDENNVISASGGASYTAGDGITITGNEIKVTPNKFVERKAETTPNRLMAFQDNTGLIKEIPVVWDSDLGKLSTSEFNATTVGGGEGKVTATKLSDGTTTETVTNIINKQDKLIAGQNITIAADGKTISAAGGTNVEANVEITGDEDELISLKVGDKVYQNLNYHPFPEAFIVNKTLKEFGQSIVNYAGFATGCTWFGGIECTDLPGNMMQCECKVTAIRDKISWARNIAIVEIYSSEVAPFYWHYNTDSWDEGTGIDDWKLVASIDESKFPTTAVVGDSYNVKVKKVSAPAGSFGWEFYTAEGGGGEPDEYLSSASVDENNNLKINNKNGQEVVNCIVNYALDNAKVKAVLTEAEKETLLSGVTGTTWIAAQSNISSLQSGKQDKLTAGENITISADNVISATGGSGGNIDSITVGGEKLLPYEKDVKIVLGNSLAYSDQEPGLAYKNLHVNFKSTHGLEVDGTNGLKVKVNKTSGTISLDANGLKVADNKFVELPNEPVAGQGLNVPYYFDVNYSADKVTVKDYTVDLLDKSKAPQQFSIDINCATQTNAGLLSAADKKKIDEGQLPADPTDVDAEYVLATKYVDGAWVKYWKEIANKSDVVDRGTVDYMVIKS